MLTSGKIDLIFHEITDPHIRENFSRIANFLNQNTPFKDFKFFEVDIPEARVTEPIAHGMSFTPLDIVVLSAQGDQRFYFINQFFDYTNIYITTSGPVRLRFLAGRYTDPGYEKPSVNYPFTAPF